MDNLDKFVIVAFAIGSLILIAWLFNIGGEVMNEIIKWSGLVLIGIGTGYFLASGKK